MPSDQPQYEDIAGSSPEPMREILERFEVDRACLSRRYPVELSERRRRRMRVFLSDWREVLEGVDFDSLGPGGRAEWVLFRNLLAAENARIDLGESQARDAAPLVPFLGAMITLDDDRRDHAVVQPELAARALASACAAMKSLKQRSDGEPSSGRTSAPVAVRAARQVEQVRVAVEQWYSHYSGYDPEFVWWVETPYRAFDEAAKDFAKHLRENVGGVTDPDAIVGDPLGREPILDALRHALIPYSPEELFAIAQREADWCIGQAKAAARELGFDDDWRSALEHVKGLHEQPGHQPALIRDLAREAADFLRASDLITVPPLAEECWRMEMMSAERQKVNPFFLGGETIIVSFPTGAMGDEEKRMSLRANNRHFCRATVHHELIPGHHLQHFSQLRYRPYRRILGTPFWTEGWPLHWEMLLWDRGFAHGAEDRIGMLFWRLHRCVRVLFSLGFHLGKYTAQECVEMLVNDVGHERSTAEGEVRRSFGGDYGPLYQCAYLIGGLQVRALRVELVESGRMSDRAFHDAVLRENCMPIAVLRALLTGATIDRDFAGDWRFAGAPTG